MKLKLNNLTKTFENHTVLDSVSLEIPKVHSLVLIGPSGGGKTTLLRMIAGLEHPTDGNIEMNSRVIPYTKEVPIDHSKELREYRKKIGIVYQNYNLFPHLTALENITLPLEKVHNLSQNEAHERATELLKRFQLIEHARKKPSQLSGGQKQRIAISRAIAVQPEYLLLDEPTSALDPEFTSEVLDMIDELQRNENIDIIIITHHMGFARYVSDYLLFIANKTILAHGSPNYMFDNTENIVIKNFFEKILSQ